MDNYAIQPVFLLALGSRSSKPKWLFWWLKAILTHTYYVIPIPCLVFLIPWCERFKSLAFFFFFLRKISPELTSTINPPLFAEEDWPWANIWAHLPLLYMQDTCHSMACQVMPCLHPGSKPLNSKPERGNLTAVPPGRPTSLAFLFISGLVSLTWILKALSNPFLEEAEF